MEESLETPVARMRAIFEKAQENIHPRLELVKEMRRLYQELILEEFFTLFVKCLNVPLSIQERYPPVERTFDFIVKFSLSLQTPCSNSNNSFEEEGEEEILSPFIVCLFKYFIQISTAKNQAVRFRICYTMNKIIDQLNPDVVVEDDLFEQMCETLLKITKDKAAPVRAQAMLTLAKFQNPASPSCPVLDAYLFHLKYDPQAEVRISVLKVIQRNQGTVLPIVEQTRNPNESVRSAAYSAIATGFHIKSLKIAIRVRLLREGLTDRSSLVQKVVRENLIPVWLKCKDEDPIELLKALDVQDAVETTEKTLKVIFDSKPPKETAKSFAEKLDGHRRIPKDELTCELAIYWRYLIQYLKSVNAEDCLDYIMPDLPPFCDYIKSYAEEFTGNGSPEEQLQHAFVCEQLLNIAAEYNLSDQAGRTSLANLSSELLSLPKLQPTLIKSIIASYAKTQPNEIICLENLARMISDIREPLISVTETLAPEVIRKIELEVANYRLRLHELKVQLEQCIATQDFAQAQKLKDEISEVEETKDECSKKLVPASHEMRTEKNDSETLLKCVTIVSEVLSQLDYTSLNPTLLSLLDTLVLPGIQNADPAVRNTAVKALGFCCLLSKEIAQKHFILLLEISKIDLELIKATAITVIFDIFLMFGLDVFCSDEDHSNASSKEYDSSTSSAKKSVQDKLQQSLAIITHFSSLLDSECSELRLVVVQGIAKLLLHHRIYSPMLFAHLVLLWFNPATGSETFIRHFIGEFFAAFAVAGQSSQECVDEAFLPIVRMLLEAPMSSPLSEVEISAVVEFLINLTAVSSPSKSSSSSESPVHGHVALKLCNEVLQLPLAEHTRNLVKPLNALSLSLLSKSTLKDMLSLSEKMLQEVVDQPSLKIIKKFVKSLKEQILITSQEPPSQSKSPEKEVHQDVGQQGSDEIFSKETLIEDLTPSTVGSINTIPETPMGSSNSNPDSCSPIPSSLTQLSFSGTLCKLPKTRDLDPQTDSQVSNITHQSASSKSDQQSLPISTSNTSLQSSQSSETLPPTQPSTVRRSARKKKNRI